MHRYLKRAVGGTAVAGAAGAAAYVGLVTGACPLDLGVGRRVRRLRTMEVDVAAPREVVFDVIAQPYLGRPTQAMREKVRVLDRGSDLVLAAHVTPVRGRLRAVTVETVRFTPPERVAFRLVRGPVPYVVEEFVLDEVPGGTRLRYDGELGADLWRAGEWWAGVVARTWEATVAASFASVKAEAERRAARPVRG